MACYPFWKKIKQGCIEIGAPVALAYMSRLIDLSVVNERVAESCEALGAGVNLVARKCKGPSSFLFVAANRTIHIAHHSLINKATSWLIS